MNKDNKLYTMDYITKNDKGLIYGLSLNQVINWFQMFKRLKTPATIKVYRHGIETLVSLKNGRIVTYSRVKYN